MNNFLAALNGEPHDFTPVWFMRQAGRYLKGYRELRGKHSIKEICMDPELTLKVTSEPIGLLGVDAAIIFSDITTPLEAMGFHLDFLENVGPVISNPLNTNKELAGIFDFSVSEMQYGTYAAIRKFKVDYPDVPIIGFSGGPLTIASYLTLGHPDRDLSATRTLFYRDDRTMMRLMQMIKEMVIANCREQVKSGADAIQIFDSWAGFLPPYLLSWYRETYLTEIASELSGLTKTIYFSTQTGGMLEELARTGFDYLSLDWRVSLPLVSSRLNSDIGLQGNIDPVLASRAPKLAIHESGKLSEQMKAKDNYIFNLGHGVLPDTDPETLKEIVRTVHQSGRSR